MRPRIAILDDERRMADVLAMVLGTTYRVETFYAANDFLAAFQADPHDLLLTDLKMPQMDGLQVLQRARALVPTLPVVLITAHATVQTAVAAMRHGAFDYLQKPVDNHECRRVIARALEVTRLSRENRYLRAQLQPNHELNIVAESPQMQAVFDLCRRAARSRSTVLVTGESGTGKELVARAIHFHSDRVGGPFVAVNCKAFAAGVLESELFGHEKGAFTGAERAREGVFERANGGTVLLDEIGEVDFDFQAKLLRVLQEREVRRVGADRDRHIDVRVVAATNRDLLKEVRQGRFREDLYFRLAVIPVHIPPLRQRPADVLPLATHFLERITGDQNRRIHGWSNEVERFLQTHNWPGNVRELENTLERGVVLARTDRIELEDLLIPAPATATTSLQDAMDAAARTRIQQALAQTGGKRAEAARLLGVERTTLYRLMRRLETD